MISPCPFCGSAGFDLDLRLTRDRCGKGFAVHCNDCGARGPISTLQHDADGCEQDAVRWWNSLPRQGDKGREG